MFFDAHSHLDMLVREPSEIPLVLEEAFQGGLSGLAQVSTDPAIHHACLPYIQASGKEVYPVCGLPHTFRGDIQAMLPKLNEIARAGQIFAIGEIGLDYARSPTGEERAAQWGLFRRQLELAAASGLPVVIHTRDAADDTLRALDEFPAPRGAAPVLRGMIHCFTGGLDFAREVLARGFAISFSGVVTFANAGALRAAVPEIPCDRLLVESDAPYLAPVPFRGRQNRPEWVRHTLDVIAALRGCTPEEAADTTARNARRLFGRCAGADSGAAAGNGGEK